MRAWLNIRYTRGKLPVAEFSLLQVIPDSNPGPALGQVIAHDNARYDRRHESLL